MKRIILGLQILLKYAPDGGCFAEHDVLYAAGPQEVSEEDKEALDKLGWFWNEDFDSWSKFT